MSLVSKKTSKASERKVVFVLVSLAGSFVQTGIQGIRALIAVQDHQTESCTFEIRAYLWKSFNSAATSIGKPLVCPRFAKFDS